MLEIFAAVLTVAVLTMGWQHRRYLRVRRDLAQDRQRLLHASQTFHVIVFFKLRSGDRVADTARQFKQQLLSYCNAQLIYAGQTAFTVNAEQMKAREWDGVLLFEYPSRADYEQSRVDPRTNIARQLFADSYFHGMRRNRSASLWIPQNLLWLRVKDLLTGKWRVEPLHASTEFATSPEFQIWRARAARLRALHEINRQGLVVFNLVKYGPDGHQGVLDAFGTRLASRMAAASLGPLHIGRSVALEEFARFNHVYIVFYSNPGFFADLLSSQFFNSIAGNRTLVDSIRVPTAPITERL
jgi:hypothetical protein